MPVKHTIAWTSFTVLATAAPLAAHVPDVVTPESLWTSWTFEPFVILPLAMASCVYGRGVVRVWASAGRGHGISRANVLSFAVAIVVLGIALVSPLDSLGGTLLSAHMAQHGLLAGIAPPLLLMARPGVGFAWGLQPLWNAGPATMRTWRLLAAAARALSAPVLATMLHAVMLWAWHAPALFGAAVAYDWVHALQHLCFFLPSLFFWQALLDAASPRRAAISTVAALLTFMHTGLLGGLLTMAPEPLYRPYIARTGVWGLTPLEDQQIAGLLMWVPMGLPYLVVGLWLASRLLARDFDATPAAAHIVAGPSAGRETAS